MSNKGLLSLIDVWKIVGERRLEAYDHKGILYFERDSDGVIQERYFKSYEAFKKEYPTLRINGLMVDLSEKDVDQTS